MKNVIFIGGIHGVGKGQICKSISDELNIPHYSASDLIKWSEIKEDARDKSVEDLGRTQKRLIAGLNQLNDSENIIVLDGHFVLFGQGGTSLEKVDFEVFKQIAPVAIAVVTDEVSEIANRLSNRDDRDYDLNLLQQMQHLELVHAKDTADRMEILFLEIGPNNASALKALILKLSTNL